MADAKPDYFPAPFQDQRQHDRTTPASMGGARPILPPSMVRGPGRPPNDPAAARAARQRADRQTRDTSITGSGVMPASGPLSIDLGGPMTGYTWDLKQIMVGPEDMTVLPYAAGVTTLVFLRSQAGSTDTTPTNCLSWTGAWPAQGNWGRHEANVESGEAVQVVVVGLPAGTLVIVGATVEQTASDVTEDWSL